jgi:hypothetical protein
MHHDLSSRMLVSNLKGANMPRLSCLIGFCAVVNMGLICIAARGNDFELPPSEVAAQDARILSLQPKIKNADFRVREEAFDEITAPLRKNHGYGRIDSKLAADSTKHAVTELLSYEFGSELPPSTVPRQVRTESIAEAGEALANYTPALIQAVMELHDPESIPLLYRQELLMSGTMATSALAYFGRTEASHVVKLLDEAREGGYKGALEMVVFGMLNNHTIDDPALLGRLETKFILQTYSPRASVRSNGAVGLSYFPDAKARNRLMDMAAHDPWVTTSRLDHKPEYSVRETAEMALRGPVSQ